MDLFSQPGFYTHIVEYEKYQVRVSFDIVGFELKRREIIDESSKKWVKSLPMAESDIESFIRFFVTGCRSSTGEFRIVKLDKPTDKRF